MPGRSFNSPVAALLAALFASNTPAAPDSPGTLFMPPPGRYTSLDTHRIYYHCSGHGSPLVVIDAGLGGSALEWTPVHEALARHTRVCTYDRAGYGWSDPGPAPRTSKQAVNELRRVLRQAGERPPYVLVGHSLGGFNMRYFAARYPHEVAALVLVESSHPQELPVAVGRADGRRNAINGARLEQSAAASPHATAALFLNSRRKAIFAQMDELANFPQSAAEVLAAGPLAALPLVVITRDPGVGGDIEREAQWQQRQHSLLALAPGSRLVMAGGSGHDVHVQRPDVIVREILAVLPQRVLAEPRTGSVTASE